MGQIISRPGSGAWTWCDVHSTDKGMQIPLMTTVVFNNYASNLYGKKNNKWILSNSVTGEELLNVKNTPYFIYTFTAPGNYTISNSVEDAAGNVYVQSNPGYIEVVNHKQKNPDDRNPDFVDSFDYGQPEAFPGRDYQARKLAKDLAADQASILNDEIVPFGVGFTVYHNPDATFRQD
jgi:PKD repeat protein